MARELGNLHLKVGGEHRVIKTSNFCQFGDGFSFCVVEELEAFQAAFCYQGHRVKVDQATPGYGWLIQVYNK
ncbi:MAG: hypothetical protein Q7K26_01505 [bacterium]|nr:hypothetical protein [bacterium]